MYFETIKLNPSKQRRAFSDYIRKMSKPIGPVLKYFLYILLQSNDCN